MTDDLVIRPAADDELWKVTELWKRSSKELGRPMMPKQLAASSNTILLAVRGERVLGFVNFKHLVRKPQSTIYDVAVQPFGRRGGVGRSLVAAVFDASPHDRVVLKCIASNPACRFYLRLGFVVTGQERAKSGARTVIQQFELTSPPLKEAP